MLKTNGNTGCENRSVGSPWVGSGNMQVSRTGDSASICSAPGASQNLALFNQDGTGEEEILVCPWPESQGGACRIELISTMQGASRE